MITNRTTRSSLLIAVALVLAVSATATVRDARAQDNNLASITIRKAVCPEGYTGTDYYEDCYASVGSGYTFSLSGPGYAGGDQTTGASGFAAFEGISADGTYTLTELFPADIIDFAVACSAGGSPFPIAEVEGGIELDLTTSDDLRCDWFNVPVGPATNNLASITFYKAICPPGYAGDDYYTDCAGTPGSGIDFTLTGPGFDGGATTGADGFAFFEGIEVAGDFVLAEDFPSDVESYVVFCSEDGEAFPFEYVDVGIAVTLALEDDLRCDWFDIPAAGAPTAPATVTPAPTAGAGSGTSGVATLPRAGAGTGAGKGAPIALVWALLLLGFGAIWTGRRDAWRRRS